MQYHVHGDSGGRRGHDEQLPENAGDGDGTGFCASGGGKALGSGQRRAGGERTGDCGGD